jgi:4-amino-4-deoxy-L-arabinose transferase-like glycosyltransferase
MLQKLSSRPDLVRVGVLILLCLALYFFGLGQRQLWDPDEGMHASTSKVMVQSGNWLVPQFNGEPFYDKPPLFNWLVALSFVIFGFTEFAARLPAALIGTLTVLATYRYGRHLVGENGAFLGAIVLATSVGWMVLSRIVVHDILLALFVTLACFAFYRGYTDESRRTKYFMLMYASVGVAVLAKGPVGAVVPGGVILIFLALRRELRFIPRLMLVRGALVAALVAVPPYVLMGIQEPEYLRYFLWEKNVGSFVSEESRHPNPFYYYVPALLGGFFPWSAFLPLTVWKLLRRPTGSDPGRLFLLVWAGFVFVFFSAATSKLPTYVLPLFPAVALLVGDLWARFLSDRDGGLRRGILISYLCLAAIVVWMVPTLWLDARGHRLFDPEVHTIHLIAISTILASSVVVSTILAWKKYYRALFGVTAAMIAGLMIYMGMFLLPMVDSYRSSKWIAIQIDGMLPPGEKITFYNDIRDGALFYADREAVELRNAEEFEDYLETEGALAIVDLNWIHQIEHLQDRYRIVEQYGNKVIVEAVAAPDHILE